MNERIKLLRQAARHFACTTELPGSDQWFEKCDTKFAELIVLECEQIAKNPKWYSESPSDGWRNPIRHVCNEMKENFGIK